MPSEGHYDDSAFNYFALSVLLVILVPTSIAYVKKWKAAFSDKYTGLCSCDECKGKAKKLQVKERKPSSWGIFKFVLWILVWVLFIYLLTKARSEPVAESKQAFDPYEILGLDIGAGDDEIKKQYRKLSLKWHPDKNPGNQEASDKFIAVAKAYDTLTDPGTREKWEKYGNPDGPQAFSVGIALPSWLVDNKNSLPVLAIYIAFLVIVFPTIAICYWQSQKELAHNQINKKTMYFYYQNLTENMRFRKLLDIISLSYEYVTSIQLRHSDEPVLAKLKPLLPVEEHKLINRNKKKPVHPHLIKNTLLWYTHFSRLHKMLTPQMQNDLEILLTHSPKLIAGMVELSAARTWLVPTVESIELLQMIVQGVWSETSRVGRNTAFQQIPHITEDMVRRLAVKKWKVTSVLQFSKLDIESRKEFYAAENFSLQEITDIEQVLRQLPHDVDMNFNTEVDEDDENLGITAGSIVTLKVNFTRPSHPQNLKDKDAAIDVHCPLFPMKKRELWWVLIADERANRILGLKRIDSLQDQTEVKIPFPVPRKPGNYLYTIILLCDSYVGFDTRKPLKINVGKEVVYKKDETAEEDEEFNEEDELSDQEEDKEDRLSSGSETESDVDEEEQPATKSKGKANGNQASTNNKDNKVKSSKN